VPLRNYTLTLTSIVRTIFELFDAEEMHLSQITPILFYSSWCTQLLSWVGRSTNSIRNEIHLCSKKCNHVFNDKLH